MEVLDPTRWAEQEFGEAKLGDVRRTRTLVEVAENLAGTPGGTLCASVSDWSLLKRGYSLLACEKVTYAAIMARHIERTRSALRESGEYFVTEDTTTLNYDSHLKIDGMGWMGDGRLGLSVHTSLVTRIERWDGEGRPVVTVVGMARQEAWTRHGESKRKTKSKDQRRKGHRESERWAVVVDELSHPPLHVRWTYMADRESDIFSVFSRCQQEGWDFIIRASEPRALVGEEGHVIEAAARGRLLGRKTVSLRARSATRERPAVAAREAVVEVRSTTVTVRPPRKLHPKPKAVTLHIVEVREVDPPPDAEPLYWVLLTSWSCSTLDEAWRVAQSYATRWLIEEYHKALKTGTGVEKAQLTTYARIHSLVGILAIVALRLLSMKLLAKALPDAPITEEVIGPDFLEVLEARFGTPKGGWTYRTTLVTIARLGGFPARKSDGLPGWITIWRGWQKLIAMVEGVELIRAARRRRGNSG